MGTPQSLRDSQFQNCSPVLGELRKAVRGIYRGGAAGGGVQWALKALKALKALNTLFYREKNSTQNNTQKKQKQHLQNKKMTKFSVSTKNLLYLR